MRRQVRGALGAVALLAFLCAACGDTVEVLLDCVSPDGQFAATFFMIRDGSSAGSLHTRLVLRRAQDRLRPDAFVLQLAGGYDVRVAWVSARRLRVEFPDDSRAEKAETQAWVGERFEVTYAAVPGSKGLLVPSGSVCLRDSRAPR